MKKLTTQQFINKANQIHNNKYDYSKVNYINAKTKIIIICKRHNEFIQNPGNHLFGNGCSKCVNNIKYTTKEFIKKAKQVHKNKYDYSKVRYINAKTKAIIICKKHGRFLQTPNSHLCGQKCPRCNKTHKLSTDIFIKKAKQVHDSKYDYSKVKYINTKTKVIIVCKKHKKFLQIPGNHLKGHGCPKCNNIVSKKEIEWLDKIEKENNIKIERNTTIYINKKRIYPDGLHKQSNTIYEYYGNFWHGNPKIYNQQDINKVNKKSFGKLYQQTLKRENLIKSAGYNLVVKWGD